MRSLAGRQVLLLVAAVALLATVVVGVYGLVRGPGGEASPSLASRSPEPAVATHSDAPVADLHDRSLPHTTDPIAYARAVATSLFDWDTASGYLPADYTAAVLADADPSGEETPGLLDDIATYLPTTTSGSTSGQWTSSRRSTSRARPYRPPGPRPLPRRTDSCDPVRRRSRSPAPGTAAASGTGARGLVVPGVVHGLRRLPARIRPMPRAAALPARQPVEVIARWECGPSRSAQQQPSSSPPEQWSFGIATLFSPAAAGSSSCLWDDTSAGSARRLGPGPGRPERGQHQRRDRHPQPEATPPSRGRSSPSARPSRSLPAAS